MITMAQLWDGYWRQVLSGLTVVAVTALCTGLFIGFKIYFQVQEIKQDIRRMEFIQQRQQLHEVALIELSDHAGFETKKMLEILNGSPYRETEDDDQTDPQY